MKEPSLPNSTVKGVFEILMVEDSPTDVLLIREAFKENRVQGRLNVVGTGEEALDYLNRTGKQAGAKTPDFILLDLNLPGMDGRAFLRRIKIENLFKTIPVFVLTGSKADLDVKEVYELNAACYIVKPAGIEGYINVVKKLHDFWMTVAWLPPKPSTAA